MKKFTMFACAALMLGLALSSVAGDYPVDTNSVNPNIHYTSNANGTLHGGNANFNKAAGDTIVLMGPTGTYKGDFENSVGGAMPDGWYSWDITQSTASHWSLTSQLSSDPYMTGLVGQTLWCGTAMDACAPSDSAWGYGNSWNESVEWTYTVPHPAFTSTVTLTGDIFYDTEKDWDYVYFSKKTGGQKGYSNVDTWTGTSTMDVVIDDTTTITVPTTEAISESITYLPADYFEGNKIVLAFRFQADSAASDEDCWNPTEGPFFMDNMTVTVNDGAKTVYSTTDDFTTDMGTWTPIIPQGVGNFAKIWEDLTALDPCTINPSKQVAFIDDGLVVPGTGGSNCINWCYGPGGYIVNTKGGLAGPLEHLHTAIESPVMNWPDQTYDGIVFLFDGFVHEDLSDDSPGMFYTWSVRSAATDSGDVITEMPWVDRNYVYYGGPGFLRTGDDVTDLMEPGRNEVQLQATCYELGYAWGWVGDDGFPAPYLDNFSVKLYKYTGPGIAVRELELAQDNFPETGIIDTADLSALSVRFDMANNISPASDAWNDPGDSLMFQISPVRAGSILAGAPELHWVLNPNHTFDSVRSSDLGLATSGIAYGDTAISGVSGLPVADEWAFDLPDTGFLFPGDVLQYYVTATDDVDGDQATVTAPADLTGYGDFSHPLAYSQSYTVHCLPTITGNVVDGYEQPKVLFIDDSDIRFGSQNEFYGSFDNLGMVAGTDYDIYYVNAPTSGVGDGIGGRATAVQLANYDDIVYTCGNSGVNTISNGDTDNDAGDDVTVLTLWLQQGNKDMFLTGDDLVSDLMQAGTKTVTFAQDYMGVNVDADPLHKLINDQVAPVVKAIAANPVIQNQDTWVAYGGCFGINTFDAITLRPGAVRLAEYLDPDGNSGQYNFSAATLMVQGNGSRCVSLPYGFRYVYNDPNATPVVKATGSVSARTQIMADVLSYFNLGAGSGSVTAVPGAEKFVAKAYPNPFNPQTTIKFTMPKSGPVSVKIFNLRGELVRTLVNDVQTAGEHTVLWDGTSNSGSSVSSGVYFYEARSGSDVQVNKITMVK